MEQHECLIERRCFEFSSYLQIVSKEKRTTNMNWQGSFTMCLRAASLFAARVPVRLWQGDRTNSNH
jgi:hypothetical protein